MAITATPRFGLPQWGAGADSPSRAGFNDALDRIDDRAAYDDGAAGGTALPTGEVVDGRYAATVNGVHRALFRRAGGAWSQVGGNSWAETQYERAGAALPTTDPARVRSHPGLAAATVTENWDGSSVRGGRQAIGDLNAGLPGALHVGDHTVAVDLALRGRVYARAAASGERGFVAAAAVAGAGNLFTARDAGGSEPWLVDAAGRMRAQAPTAFGAAALATNVPFAAAPGASDLTAMDLYAATGKPALRIFRAAGDLIGSFQPDAIALGKASWSGGSISLTAPNLSLTGTVAVTGNATVSGTLGVTGKATVGSLQSGTTDVGPLTASSATVTGAFNVNGTLAVGARLDLPTNQPSGTSDGQVRIAADDTLEVFDGTNWHGTFGSGGAANASGRKHSWYQGNAPLAGNDTYVQVTGFPGGGGGGSVASMSNGNLLLNRAGLWVLQAGMFLDHGREGLNRLLLQWESGAFPGRAGIVDIRKRVITPNKGGSGAGEAQLTWVGYVTTAQAAAAVKMFVAHIADDNSTSSSTGFFLSAEYLGA